MTLIAVTQRVTVIENYQEKRDSLDQRWIKFLYECDLIPIIVPNHIQSVKELVKKLNLDGVLLTGGDDLPQFGGTVPERDKVEHFLLEYAISRGLPLLGICRGMQVIQDYFGVQLGSINGHITPIQEIYVNGQLEMINSYHNYGANNTCELLDIWAISKDHIVKAIQHREKNIQGIMWHPERIAPFRTKDIERIRNFFNRNEAIK